jgi:hypothetical protein
MAMNLASVKAAFAAFIQRDATLTDPWVASVLKIAQDTIISEDYWTWSRNQENKTFPTVDGTAEYDLRTLYAAWNIRIVEHLWLKRDSTGNEVKLDPLDMLDTRTFAPDPVNQFGEGRPTQYYIKDDGVTVGLIKVPDAVYTVYVDFYMLAPDPAANDLLLPEQFAMPLLCLLAYMWHGGTGETDKSIKRYTEYTTWMQNILSKNNMNVHKDIKQTVKRFRTTRYIGGRGKPKHYFPESDYLGHE